MTLPILSSLINKDLLNLGKKIRKTKGFTLVELLTVITIIGILVAFTTVSFVNAQQKGRDGKRKTDLKSIKAALTLYFNEYGNYPPSATDDPGGVGYDMEYSSTSGGTWIPGLNAKYIKALPKDPLQANSLKYLNAFSLLTKLSPFTPVYAGGGGGGGYTPPTPTRVDLYYYSVSADRSTYILWASLENNNDAEIHSNANASCRVAPPTSYNYCLTQE